MLASKRQRLDNFCNPAEASNAGGPQYSNLVTTQQLQSLSNDVNKLHSKLDDMANKFDAITQCLDYVLNEHSGTMHAKRAQTG